MVKNKPNTTDGLMGKMGEIIGMVTAIGVSVLVLLVVSTLFGEVDRGEDIDTISATTIKQDGIGGVIIPCIVIIVIFCAYIIWRYYKKNGKK